MTNYNWVCFDNFWWEQFWKRVRRKTQLFLPMIDVGDKGKIGGHLMVFLKPHSSPSEACCSFMTCWRLLLNVNFFVSCKIKKGNQNGTIYKLEEYIKCFPSLAKVIETNQVPRIINIQTQLCWRWGDRLFSPGNITLDIQLLFIRKH